MLGPLRLHRFGAPAAVIGATFLVASALAAAITPAVGRFSDRHGRLVPLRLGLGAAAISLVCFTLPDDVALLAIVIIAISVTLAFFWAPAMALLSDAAEATGLEQGLAAALINLAWAGGQVVGSGGGGAVAKYTGDGLPMAIVAALCAATLIAPLVLGRERAAAGRRGRRHRRTACVNGTPGQNRARRRTRGAEPPTT